MVDIKLDSIVVIAPAQVFSDLGDEVVIFDPAANAYFGLAEVGAEVWRWLHQPVSVRKVRDAIVARFAVESAEAERDLLELLADLAARHLIEVSP